MFFLFTCIKKTHRHDVDALFFPGALELLQFLKGRGVRLCAVTNGNCDIDQIAAFKGMCR